MPIIQYSFCWVAIFIAIYIYISHVALHVLQCGQCAMWSCTIRSVCLCLLCVHWTSRYNVLCNIYLLFNTLFPIFRFEFFTHLHTVQTITSQFNSHPINDTFTDVPLLICEHWGSGLVTPPTRPMSSFPQGEWYPYRCVTPSTTNI